jgi:hypothetical protein
MIVARPHRNTRLFFPPVHRSAARGRGLPRGGSEYWGSAPREFSATRVRGLRPSSFFRRRGAVTFLKDSAGNLTHTRSGMPISFPISEAISSVPLRSLCKNRDPTPWRPVPPE